MPVTNQNVNILYYVTVITSLLHIRLYKNLA